MQALPDGLRRVDNNYVIVDNDWAVRLPDGWIYSVDQERTGGRPLVANSAEDFEKNGDLIFYSDSCFTVFKKAPSDPLAMMATAMLNAGATVVISRDDLNVSYNCYHEDCGTFCQYVVVTTCSYSYMIQLFYTDAYLGEQGRINKIEQILRTICLAWEVPQSTQPTAVPVSAATALEPCGSLDNGEIDHEKRLTDYFSDDSHVVLPEGIKIVGEGLIFLNDTMESLVIPEGVTTIEENAFGFCKALKSVVFPKSLKVIGEAAFSNCEALEVLNLPEGLLEIGKDAFRSTKIKKLEIPSTVKTVGDNAFAYCKYLEQIRFPQTDMRVSASAFAACEKLERLNLPATVQWVEDVDYSYCNNLKEFPLPSQMTQLKDKAFAACKQLTVFVVPDTVKSIGDEAFWLCSELHHVYIPASVTKFGKNIFFGVSDVTLHTEPGSSAEAYAKKSSLPVSYDMSAPDTTPDSKSAALGFDIRGTALHKYTGTDKHVVVPPYVTQIEEEAFQGSALESIQLPDHISYIGRCAFAGCSDLKRIKLPAQLECIRFAAFDCCEALEEITFTGFSLREIGKGALNNCGFKEFDIPDSVQILGDEAFYYCENLKDIWVPAAVTQIGKDVFGPEVFPTVHTPVGSAMEKYCAENGIPCDNSGYLSQVQEGFEIRDGILWSYLGKEKDVVIPNSVTKIASTAFSEESPVESVTIPESVHTIDSYAFNTCRTMKSVYIPNSVTSIGESAFFCCEQLQSIIWPTGVAQLPESVFEFCESLTTAVIPEGVTGVGASAFNSCEKLKDVYLPASVKTIGEYAFLSCRAVTLHVRPGSYAESYAKDNKLRYDYEVYLTPEQRERQRKEEQEAARRRKEAEQAKAAEDAQLKRQQLLAARRNHYNEISQAISLQMQIIAQNKGWFGAQAKARKAAQDQLSVLQAQLAREFPNGKP